MVNFFFVYLGFCCRFVGDVREEMNCKKIVVREYLGDGKGLDKF